MSCKDVFAILRHMRTCEIVCKLKEKTLDVAGEPEQKGAVM